MVAAQHACTIDETRTKIITSRDEFGNGSYGTRILHQICSIQSYCTKEHVHRPIQWYTVRIRSVGCVDIFLAYGTGISSVRSGFRTSVLQRRTRGRVFLLFVFSLVQMVMGWGCSRIFLDILEQSLVWSEKVLNDTVACLMV